jgi:hypothetical protein
MASASSNFGHVGWVIGAADPVAQMSCALPFHAGARCCDAQDASHAALAGRRKGRMASNRFGAMVVAQDDV